MVPHHPRAFELAPGNLRRPIADTWDMTALPSAPPVQRLAVPDDAPQIAELMRASVLSLFPAFYDEQQTASSAVYIAHIDQQLIDDGTYYVHEIDGQIVACGGWSRRAKLYTGSASQDDDDRLIDPTTEPARVRAMFVRGDWTRRGLGRATLEASRQAAKAEGFSSLILVATLPGFPLYQAFGFVEIERVSVPMPDGVSVEGVVMQRPIDPVS